MERGFPHQTSQGGEIEPDIGLEDERLAARQAIDRHTLEAPAVHGGIAAFNGITRAMVEAFPGRRADRDVANEAE